jgi:hypothetical protein
VGEEMLDQNRAEVSDITLIASRHDVEGLLDQCERVSKQNKVWCDRNAEFLGSVLVFVDTP